MNDLWLHFQHVNWMYVGLGVSVYLLCCFMEGLKR